MGRQRNSTRLGTGQTPRTERSLPPQTSPRLPGNQWMSGRDYPLSSPGSLTILSSKHRRGCLQHLGCHPPFPKSVWARRPATGRTRRSMSYTFVAEKAWGWDQAGQHCMHSAASDERPDEEQLAKHGQQGNMSYVSRPWERVWEECQSMTRGDMKLAMNDGIWTFYVTLRVRAMGCLRRAYTNVPCRRCSSIPSNKWV